MIMDYVRCKDVLMLGSGVANVKQQTPPIMFAAFFLISK